MFPVIVNSFRQNYTKKIHRTFFIYITAEKCPAGGGEANACDVSISKRMAVVTYLTIKVLDGSHE